MMEVFFLRQPASIERLFDAVGQCSQNALSIDKWCVGALKEGVA